MIDLLTPFIAILVPPVQPPPPYPFDRSIECRLHNFEGDRLVTWSGKIEGVEMTAPYPSRFRLSFSSDNPEFDGIDGFPIPNNGERTLVLGQGPKDDAALRDDPRRAMLVAMTDYEFQMAATWNGDWVAKISTQFSDIAVGFCKVRPMPNETRSDIGNTQ